MSIITQIKKVSAPVHLHQDELIEAQVDTVGSEFNHAVSTAPAPVRLFEPEKIDYVDLRNNLELFLEKLPHISEHERDDLLTETKNLSDAGILLLYQKVKSIMLWAVRSEWERRLEDFINGNPPPPKYQEEDSDRNPIKFLEDIWGEYLDHGVLYQDRLSDYDDKIIQAIYNYWAAHGRAPSDRLPLPKKMRTDAVLQHVADVGPDSFEEVVRAVRAWDRRTQRQPGRNHDLG